MLELSLLSKLVNAIILYMTKSQKSDVLRGGLTIIIPTFNGSPWLGKTIAELNKAIRKTDLKKFEIIIVNDGSTDDTLETIKEVTKNTKLPIRVHTQANSGRFVARRTGTNAARYPYLLFIDTRVFIGEESLDYVLKQHAEDSSREVWCAHVRVDTTGNIYARFWEGITYIAWRDYFSNPKDISYGISDFDRYPKGTTCFFIKKSILVEANEWFVKNTKDLKDSNDDTLLIRHIAKGSSINISPSFWCLYHARSKFYPYIKHVFHRGKVFVDGFLRNDGNVYFWPLVGFLVTTFLASAFILAQPWTAILILSILLIGWVLELFAILFFRVPIKDGLSLWLLSPIFSVSYGLGIWTAFIRIHFIKRVGLE